MAKWVLETTVSGKKTLSCPLDIRNSILKHTKTIEVLYSLLCTHMRVCMSTGRCAHTHTPSRSQKSPQQYWSLWPSLFPVTPCDLCFPASRPGSRTQLGDLQPHSNHSISEKLRLKRIMVNVNPEFQIQNFTWPLIIL